MPDLSDTVAKCRIGTAKNFTLLLLLYHTQINCYRSKLTDQNALIRWDHNLFLKSDMLMEDKMIIWNGKPAVLRLGIDVSHLQ